MPIISVNTPGIYNLVADDVTWSTPGVDLMWVRPIVPAAAIDLPRLYGRVAIGGHIPTRPQEGYLFPWQFVDSRGSLFCPPAMVTAGFRSKWGTVPILMVYNAIQWGYTLEWGYA